MQKPKAAGKKKPKTTKPKVISFSECCPHRPFLQPLLPS